MGLDIGQLQYSPAKAHRRLPVAYSKQEIASILSHLSGSYKLMVELMYGTGLRSAELLSLHIKDIDLHSQNIVVRSSKGGKDRTEV